MREGSERGAELIDEAAFQAVTCEHQLSAAVFGSGVGRHVFEWGSLELEESFGPLELPAAVGGGPGCAAHFEGLEQARPEAIGAGFGPRGSA